MEIQIFDSYQDLSEKLADKIISLVKKDPAAVLCLAAGDTPRLAYQLLVDKAKREKIDFTQCTFIGLDEWVGVAPENEGSCHFFLKTHLFDPLSISASQVHLFNALTNNLDEECKKMDAAIAATRGIDCMVVGIGMNGHIGFNEPGVSWELKSHVINLDENTRVVGQKYFSKKTVLDKGITLGFQHLRESKAVILIANGSRKAEIIQQAVASPVHARVPASIMQTHTNGYIMIDQEAASLLQRNSHGILSKL